MAKITLCGSPQFQKDSLFFETVNWIIKDLTLKGHLVYDIPIFLKEDYNLSQKEIDKINKVHTDKIEISDEIIVINMYGYIGERTQKEIEYANTLNKKITYLNEIKK